MTVRYRASLDMGVRTTQSPPLLIWKTLYGTDQALTAEEIAAASGLSLSLVEAVVGDPFYKRYGILTEEEWEAAHPPKPVVEEEPAGDENEDAAADGEADEEEDAAT